LGKEFPAAHLILYSHGGVNPIYAHNKETNTLLNYSVAVFLLKEVGSVPCRKRRGMVLDKTYETEKWVTPTAQGWEINGEDGREG